MKTILLGLDALDPAIVERLHSRGDLPHLGKLITRGKYARFGVTNPPQSEVSWTSIATGLDPTVHGLTDFVHRNPKSYALNLSLLPTETGWSGTRFVPPTRAKSLFEMAAEQGYPSTALFWPAQFPARLDSLVNALPGLGTPDLQGRWGVGTLYSAEANPNPKGKIPVERLNSRSRNVYESAFIGTQRRNGEAARLPFKLTIGSNELAELQFGRTKLSLKLGEWSPIIPLTFKLGFFTRVQALTRVIFTNSRTPTLYALPLQLHPLKPLWPYGTPQHWVNRVWEECGAWLTVGWAQDTTALNEGHISSEQFLALCESVMIQRERILTEQLAWFDEGVLGCVFDTLDRVQHLFWRDRPDIIEQWYQRMDALVGRVFDRVEKNLNGADTRMIVVSDHGFTDFNHKVHLNRWLQLNGYQQSRIMRADDLSQTNWAQTEAYAIGLNSLHLNQQGREGQGVVSKADRASKLATLREKLLQWHSAEGHRVVQEVYIGEEPDLVIGYAKGFRASAETALGGYDASPIVPNTDRWSGDHCVDPSLVPGVLFATDGLENFPTPTYRDMPALAVGMQPSEGDAPPPVMSDEEQAAMTEQLQSLGYL
ncbi:MAG: alkaline phosphatase family protein [Candidatus Promineifilaceae bacterium]